VKQYKQSLERRIKRREYAKRWAKANPEKVRANMQKWCAENREKRKINNKKWRVENQEQQREYHKQYRLQHLEKLRQNARDYCKNNRQAFTEYGRQWRKNNPEKFREQQRRWSVRNKQWRKENLILLRIHDHRRREREKATMDRSAINVLSQLISSAGKLKCGLCEKNMPKNDRTIDHIIPLAKGGTGDVWNLRIVHHLCNIRKHATMPDELNFSESNRHCKSGRLRGVKDSVGDSQAEPQSAATNEGITK
jgi:hypothetical protein